jgi:DNA-3-methyladenine glycosylase I
MERLLADAGIIRNRQKIEAAITNARCFLAVQKEFGSFDRYIWQFVGGKTIRHRIRSLKDMPATTPESDRISKDLRSPPSGDHSCKRHNHRSDLRGTIHLSIGL